MIIMLYVICYYVIVTINVSIDSANADDSDFNDNIIDDANNNCDDNDCDFDDNINDNYDNNTDGNNNDNHDTKTYDN